MSDGTPAHPWLASYAEGVPPEIDEVTGTLVDLIDDAARTYRSHVALEFFGRTTRYEILHDQIDRVAEGLRRLGVKHGDRVALLLPNCPQHVVAFYAILRLGAVVVEHNPLYTDRELRHLFEDHGATVAVAWDKLIDRLGAMPKDIRFSAIVSVDLTREMPASKRLALRLPVKRAKEARAALTTKVARVRGLHLVPWRDVVRSRLLLTDHERPTLDDVALLQYTSGTTGTPKGAILTHRNLRSNVEQGRAWVPGLADGSETIYGVLPFFHAYGLTLCLTFAMRIGARLVLFPKFDVDLVLDAAKKNPPTFLPAVPPIYQRLAEAGGKRRIDLTATRFAISGAMNLPASVVASWEKVTGGLLVEGFGLTETSPVALGNPVGPTRRSGTVGVPFPSTEAKVVKRKHPDVEVAPGEPGELLLRGPQIFQGYWRRPDETAAVLIDGGWFRTGDIVTMSADGFVTIVDRIKELIVTGGFNVAPSEVEEAVLGVAGVAEVAVVGIPREAGGEDVTAAVVLTPAAGGEFDEAAARAHCKEHLAAYKVPKRFVVVPELPKNLIGKTLRRKVRESLIADA